MSTRDELRAMGPREQKLFLVPKGAPPVKWSRRVSAEIRSLGIKASTSTVYGVAVRDRETVVAILVKREK